MRSSLCIVTSAIMLIGCGGTSEKKSGDTGKIDKIVAVCEETAKSISENRAQLSNATDANQLSGLAAKEKALLTTMDEKLTALLGGKDARIPLPVTTNDSVRINYNQALLGSPSLQNGEPYLHIALKGFARGELPDVVEYTVVLVDDKGAPLVKKKSSFFKPPQLTDTLIGGTMIKGSELKGVAGVRIE